jgi:hypothetical protein
VPCCRKDSQVLGKCSGFRSPQDKISWAANCRYRRNSRLRVGGIGSLRPSSWWVAGNDL